MLLGVNVDHVATLRQARGTAYPDPLAAAQLAERSGADGITVHLREDRRHIQDADVERMVASLSVPLNLEMAVTEEMLGIATRLKPAACCLVPEKRAELTTEGGLDVIAQRNSVAAACQRLNAAGVRVSLFIDPDQAQIDAAVACGAPVVELHTGTYADAAGNAQAAELARIESAAQYAAEAGLIVHAGHGLNFVNVQAIAKQNEIVELNIGHFLIAQAVTDGLAEVVQQMKKLMLAARV